MSPVQLSPMMNFINTVSENNALVTSVFPVVPLLFRNMVVIQAPQNSSGWRCQDSQSHQIMSCAAVTHRKKATCNSPPSRIEGQVGWPPGVRMNCLLSFTNTG